MATHLNTGPERSNAYSIFILVLTVLSLMIMAALALPLSDSTIQLLTVYDNVICVVFLIDFLLNRVAHAQGASISSGDVGGWTCSVRFRALGQGELARIRSELQALRELISSDRRASP